MRIAVPREAGDAEQRVALSPDMVKRLLGKKFAISVQAGAGSGALFTDEEYAAAGAQVEKDEAALYAAGDLVLQIGVPTPAQIGRLREGTALVSLLYPLFNRELVRELAHRRITAFAVDSIPRTTVAQMMDVLS